jgi:hypothetical protein
MSEFRFQIVQMKSSTPQEWLRVWAGMYQGYDETEYRNLIEKHKSFSAEDFRRIGKWKDGATTEGQWKPNVASVAYPIWEQAAASLLVLIASRRFKTRRCPCRYALLVPL